METAVHRNEPSRIASWLAWCLLGAFLTLGFLSYQAMGLDHRHVVDGVVVIHDHLSSGFHHHPIDSVPGDQDRPASEDEASYLCQGSQPLPDDLASAFELSTSLTSEARPEHHNSDLESLQDLGSPPLRGPPAHAPFSV